MSTGVFVSVLDAIDVVAAGGRVDVVALRAAVDGEVAAMWALERAAEGVEGKWTASRLAAMVEGLVPAVDALAAGDLDGAEAAALGALMGGGVW